MTYKRSINASSRTVYISADGNDDESGFSLENAKKTFASAITVVNALLPPSSLTNPTAIIVEGAGFFEESGLTFPDACQVSGPDAVITPPFGDPFEPSNLANCRLLALATLADGSTCVELNNSDSVGFDSLAVSVFGASSTGVHLSGTATQSQVQLTQLHIGGAGSIGFLDETNNEDPEIFSCGFITLDADNTTAIKHNPSLGTSKLVVHIGTMIADDSAINTIGLLVMAGEVNAIAISINADTAIIVESGASLSITATCIKGDIIVNSGGVLHCEVPEYTGGTVTNNGTIHGRIGDSIYGSQQFTDGIDMLTTTDAFRLPRLTTTERDALTPLSGMLIFNTTTGESEEYSGSGWVGSSGAGVDSVAAGDNLNDSGTASNPIINLSNTITSTAGNGDLTLKGGANNPTGGDVIIAAGEGSSHGGDINLITGYGFAGNAGDINLIGSEGTDGNGGGFKLTGGKAATDDGSGTGGGFDLTTGVGGFISGDGGDINLTTGSTDAGTGSSGSITLDIGVDAGGGSGSISLAPTNGKVSIGTSISDAEAAINLNTAKVTNATHTGDATGDTALTLATVNSNVGSFTGANITVNEKGLITAISDGPGGDVTAASNIADNSLVRGDGGAKGVQGSSITIDDSDNMTGVNTLEVSDDFRVGGNNAVIFTDVSNGSVTLGNNTTGTSRLNVYGPGNGLNQDIMSIYNSVGGILIQLIDQVTAESVPARIVGDNSLGLGYQTTEDAPHIWYINGRANEKMRLESDGLTVGRVITSSIETEDGAPATGISIKGGNSTAGSGAAISTIAGNGVSSGGDINTLAGDATVGSGGTISSTAGSAGTNGNGGNIVMAAGASGITAGIAGAVALTGGLALHSNNNGGTVALQGGPGNGTGEQGAIVMQTNLGGTVIIGASNYEESAKLEIVSASKGFLMPRMTSAERDNISSPATGLEIFNITINKPQYFNGSAWAGTAGNESLAETLVNGNTSSGTDLIISSGDTLKADAVTIGSNNDLILTHDGSNGLIKNDSGSMVFDNPSDFSSIVQKLGTNTSATSFEVTDNTSSTIMSIKGDKRVSMAGNLIVGGTSIDASAQLELVSNSKGFLKTRLTTTERDAISSPATGLEIFNTTTNEPEYFNGSAWLPTSGSETLAETLANGNTTGGNDLVISSGDEIVSPDGSNGVNLNIKSGDGSLGNGGNLSIESGSGSGAGGALDITSGDGTFAGGPVNIKSGNVAGTGIAGTITLLGGVSGGANAGGQIHIFGGIGGDSNGDGGQVLIHSGSGGNGQGDGALLSLEGGQGYSSGNTDGGDVDIQGGQNFGSGVHGDVLLQKTSGNVGIGTSGPDTSAILDIVSSDRGFLKPRMTTTQRDAISSPATGLEIYNTTKGATEFYNGALWSPERTSNEAVYVTALSDLPTPVGSVITLADNITYLILNSFDLAGNQLKTGSQSVVSGIANTLTTLTGTTSLPLFINTTGSHIVLRDIKIAQNGSGELIESDGGIIANRVIFQYADVRLNGGAIGIFRGGLVELGSRIVQDASGGVQNLNLGGEMILTDSGVADGVLIFEGGSSTTVCSITNITIATTTSADAIQIGLGAIITSQILSDVLFDALNADSHLMNLENPDSVLHGTIRDCFINGSAFECSPESVSNFSPPPADTVPKDCGFDGVNLLTCDNAGGLLNGTIRKHAGLSSSITESFVGSTNLAAIRGITWIRGDVWVVLNNGASPGIIRRMDGFSVAIISSFDSPSFEPVGITHDGSNIITLDRGTGAVSVHDGETQQVNQLFASPAGTNSSGISFDGMNLLISDSTNNLVYVMKGISPNVQYSFSGPGTTADGIAITNDGAVILDGTSLEYHIYDHSVTFDHSSKTWEFLNIPGITGSSDRGGSQFFELGNEPEILPSLVTNIWHDVSDGNIDLEYTTFSENEKCRLNNSSNGELIWTGVRDRGRAITSQLTIQRDSGGGTNRVYQSAIAINGIIQNDSLNMIVLIDTGVIINMTTLPINRDLKSGDTIKVMIRTITASPADTFVYSSKLSIT